MSKKLWLFGTYAWQGNPKALFLYMNKYYTQTHECWWIADNDKDAETIKKNTGIKNITSLKNKSVGTLFSRCDVYVTENFRENYPVQLSETAKIFNTWHGVGLKHIELALGVDSVLVESITKKYIKNFSYFRNQTLFLATSQKMEEHFLEDTVIRPEHIIRGDYPRNCVYADSELKTYDSQALLKKEDGYQQTILFAPTYRIGAIEGVLHQLIPDFESLEAVLKENNQLFIVQVHPFMRKDSYFLEMAEKYKNNDNILFWTGEYDIYEVFSEIDIAIVDYSSIFYDLLDAGVDKFVRYIPDFKQYQQDLELIGDYMDLTAGIVVDNYHSLLSTLSSDIQPISSDKREYLNEYFFGYADHNWNGIATLIKSVDEAVLIREELKELHSFDVFDTLIRRSTLKPFSVFEYVRDIAKQSTIAFPAFLLEDWVSIRNKVEHDVRDMMRKTTFERKSNTLEITLDDIYDRLQANMQLSDEQVNFLKQAEIDAEIYHVEPIQKRIDFLFDLKKQGHDVILVSDMYLPETVICTMLIKADSRLADIPLYLSSSIGYQKSTAKLYQHIFFDIKYNYYRWVHYGDNKHADGSVPRRMNIETIVHDIDDFIPFENELINSMDNYNRYPAYQLATKMHRYRTALLSLMNNKQLEQKHYAYAYAGSVIVPYVKWAIEDAIKRGYQTLYFISRDGHFLKQVADKIIEIRNYNIKTRYIYGSRKAWRLPSYINEVDEEMFWQFGNFVGMDSFDDLVAGSYLDETELLSLFPEFESLKTAKHLRGEVAENIRKIFSNSQIYRQRVLEIASEKREIVREYLQQEINPNESFAFVEFWGRGYTQDVFGRLLNDAFGREITNPFYYVRSFTNNVGTSVRHNFMLLPQNFSVFEPIFAQTPYESISTYERVDNKVVPVIIPTDATMSDIISKGLLDFTQDYLSLTILDEGYFNHAFAKFAYHYQMMAHVDQFIANIFGELKYNESSFGEAKSYAPALTLKQLQSVASKQELDKITQSIPLSLAKSDAEAVAYYQKIQKNYKLPAISVTPVKPTFAINNLECYVYSSKLPFTIISLQNNSFYMDVAFNDGTKRKDIYLKKFHTIEVTAIDWLKNGVPRLLTPYGYITANKEWVQNFDDVRDNFVENEDGGYDWQPSFAVDALIKAVNAIDAVKAEVVAITTNVQKHETPKPNSVPKSNPLQSTPASSKLTEKVSALKPNQKTKSKPASIETSSQPIDNLSDFERKLHKFSRNPHGFFRDVKNKRIAKAQVLFDEKHAVGRAMSRWVRKKFNG